MPLAAAAGRGWLLAGAAAAALVWSPGSARAQGEERFFFDAEKSAEEREDTDVDGSLTSTTLLYRESSGLGQPVIMDGVRPENASRENRLFTDLRAKLDAEHIKGGKWDFHADLRGRYVPGTCRQIEEDVDTPSNDFDPCTRTQSGAFGGNEYSVREFYFERKGDETDVAVGRQFALELAATKFDGIQVKRRKSEKWTYLGFAGLYPSRLSRDVRDDYPVIEDPMTGEESRITPVSGGVGAAYRFEKAYGSFGAVGILPLAEDRAEFGGTGQSEKTRIFGTASGYWRRSSKLDLYHYLVVDAESASGAGLTNLTLGANYRPTPSLRTFLQVTRIDTETLNVHAQTRLEDPDPDLGNVVQNNVEVLRIASESARAGVSADFKTNRFGVSVIGTLRRRPQFVLNEGDDNEVEFDQAQAADVTLRAVDRRSFKDFRFGASVTRSFGVGDTAPNRSEFLAGRLDASRELKAGRAEVEANITYLEASDESRVNNCTQSNLLNCYGTAKSRTLSVGALAFYRFKESWFAIGSLQLGHQSLTTADAMSAPVSQPSILLTTFFGRLAYRF